ncbi:Microsomal glutathione S-transferase 3 [Haplosporangium sp. Z 767]|nr:Microsomal glutathione S-transferase 3 [Haplosporangium sp. Z 767]KAF9190706.1 Microsomal glutathione S-transferase 3 [Haplosporangium sp. Z 11]
MITFTVTPDYGYTVAVTVASTLLVSFFGAKVTSYRDVAKVPLPFLYAEPAECKADHKKLIFNCYQRVHQNTLEGFASYLITLMFAGLRYPIASAALGSIWCLGRIFYYIGYTSGKPSARQMGIFGHIGEVGLLGLTGKIAYDLIMARS